MEDKKYILLKFTENDIQRTIFDTLDEAIENIKNFVDENSEVSYSVYEGFKGYNKSKMDVENSDEKLSFVLSKGDMPLFVNIKDNLENPAVWRLFDDGSGSIVGKFNRTFFNFDKFTNEIKYPNGKYGWCDFEENWMRKYEKLYNDCIYPLEKKYMDLLKNNILITDFQDQIYKKDKLTAKYIYIKDDICIDIKDFDKLIETCHELEDENHSDSYIHDNEVVEMIKTSLDKNLESFIYEDKELSFAGKLIKNLIEKSEVEHDLEISK